MMWTSPAGRASLRGWALPATGAGRGPEEYRLLTRCLIAGVFASLAIIPAAANGAAAPGGWKLVWHDEFDESDIDPSNWKFDLGGGGWGNGEAECYTSRKENAYVEGGLLRIVARREKYGGSDFTSARLKSEGLRAFRCGRIEARMKVPAGDGLWPAFWLLGSDIAEKGWPACGEIDVMEYIGKDPDLVYGTMHGPGYSGQAGIGKRFCLPEKVAHDFHVFAVEWDTDQVRWLCDDAAYSVVTRADLGGKKWVFDHPFFIILNLAVGGVFPGPVAPDTPFPSELSVDYVRVYEKVPRDSGPRTEAPSKQ
jgi:beta-glucanase (GH16 family)